MVSNTSNRVPELRFPGFEGEWDAPLIADVFDIRNGYTPSKYIAEYWEGGTIPWFRMEDIRENGGILSDSIQHITPQGVKTSGLFKKNSILLATTATIGVHAMIIADSLANQQFTNFSIRKSLSNLYIPEFVYYSFFRIDEWCKKNANFAGLLSVNVSDLQKQPFPTPSIEEQRAIADCLKSVDKMILAQSQKVKAMKEHKKGLMQQLFPKSGETTPARRFPGFEGEWEEKKFKDFTFAAGKRNKQNIPYDRYSISNEQGFVPQNDQFDGGGYLKDINCKLYIIVPPKSFAYNPARINVGSIGYQNLCKDVIVSSLYEVFQTTDECDDAFLWHWFHSNTFHNMVINIQEGGVRQYFYYDKLQGCSIFLPSIEEQQKIATCLSSLDNVISAEEKKLEGLKSHKKGLMQKLFPNPSK